MTSGDDLRALMRRWPAGVSVVTVDAEGERLGLTLGSLVSLSLEPPLVGISISRQAPIHELLRSSGAFAISLLARGQDAIAQHFARSGMPPLAHWLGIPVCDREAPAPLIDGAVGWLECRLWAQHAVSTHTFFVGEVVALEQGPGDAPLVYLGSEYVSL